MKVLSPIFIGVLLSVSLSAQENKFNFNFNHLALSVTDANASANFYINVLGLTEIENRTKVEGRRWLSLGKEGNELHLVADLKKEKVIVNKAVHLALTSVDFDAFVAKLNKLKIAYSDWPGTPNKINIRADGVKQIFFQDVDGYWLEVNSVAQK